jgi:ornithine cyclodeaminase/alanine dehydrogenase-like protein (mu-crystallin family)
MLHVLSAAAKSLGVIGYKAYTTTKAAARFHVTIYDAKSGEMSALMQADHLGQVRTGAASAVATKCLSRPESKHLGIYGSGKQARTQVLAVCKVRKIEKITAYSPTEANLKAFVEDLQKEGLPIVAATQPEQAALGQDIICTATKSRTPVLKGEWIAPGTHLNIVGSNFLGKSEIDLEVIKKTNVLVIDSKEQGRIEAGDFAEALDTKLIAWSDIHELGRVVTGRLPGRESPTEITLFKSLGIGLEDIVVAQKILLRAREMNIGTTLDL